MNKVTKFFKYLFLSLAALVSIFPFYWMIVSATNQSVDVIKGTLIPGSYIIENVNKLLSTTNFLQAMKNSFFIAIVTTVVAIFISSLAGYAFEMYKSKASERIFSFLLLSMMIPFAAIMIPLYRFFGKMNIIDSPIAAMLPYISTAFLIFFFRQNSKMFPKEINEAARIDGLSEFKIFIQMYMPIMKTTYAAAAIITFMGNWNNYLWPLIVLQSPNKVTLPIVISTLSSSYTPDYGVMMLALSFTTIPTALLFMFMQKHFVAGMLGSVK